MNANTDTSFKLIPVNLALVLYTTSIPHCTKTVQHGCNRLTDIYIYIMVGWDSINIYQFERTKGNENGG